MPILTGGRQRGDELVARADVEQARMQLRQVQELAALDTRSAWAELLAARAAWEATAGTVQQATRAYEIADVRYRAGLSTQLELSDSRLLLQQAEANRAQAARDLQVARARAALLPNLPLGAGRSGAASGQRAAAAGVPPPAQPPTQRAVSDRFKEPRPRIGCGHGGGSDKWSRHRGECSVGLAGPGRAGLGAAACGGGKDSGSAAGLPAPCRLGPSRSGRRTSCRSNPGVS